VSLSRTEVKAFYDRFGKKLDTQALYEDRAIDALVAHARFADARSVFELGCGTGRFAARLLSECLPSGATYAGTDLSTTMVGLARERLAGFAQRARVTQSDGTVSLPLGAHSVDRVIATYVLELLSQTDATDFLNEAHRVLDVGGRICLVSLTTGTTIFSRIVSTAWSSVYRLRPSLVGGCRPVSILRCIDLRQWDVEHRSTVVVFGVPSEVLVAAARETD
jgi:ubiquinone/menaquinone biosynthesis C-methylase UbiE